MSHDETIQLLNALNISGILHGAAAIVAANSQVIARIDTLERHIMSKLDELNQSISDLNDATNDEATAIDSVATTLQALRDQIGTGITDAQAAELKGKIDAVVTTAKASSTRLKGLAADPNAPVPPGPATSPVMP